MTDHSNVPVEDKIKAAAKSVEPAKEFSDALWQQMSNKKVTKRENARRWFSKPLQTVALALAVIALVIVIIGPQKVVVAFSELLGYLPGSGFIENDESTLYLSKPVSVEQDGITLTVQQVVADKNNVVVTYKFDGLSQDTNACFYDSNTLRLPDGKTRLPIGGGINGSQAQINYQPLPQGVQNFTLVAAAQSPDCTGPQKWAVDLTLGARPAGVILAPVMQGEDLQVSTPTSHSNSAEAAQVQFSIDRVAELADSYIIAGHINGNNPAWDDLSISPDFIRVSNVNGENIPVEPADNDISGSGAFSFKIVKGDYAAPLTIKFQSVTVSAKISEKNTFSFAASEQPAVGQSWTIDQPLTLMDRNVTIESVHALHDDSVSADSQTVTGYAFDMKADVDILTVFFQGTGSAVSGSGSSTSSFYRNSDGTMKIETTFPDGAPTGTVTFTADHMIYKLDGDWSMQLNLQK